MADVFLQSQVGYTDPKKYDQVIMVTQSTINSQLRNMWALEEETSKLRSFTMSNGGGSISAKLEAPKIELNTKDSTKPVYYYLTFKSGTLEVYKSDDRKDASTRDFDVKGWTICFAAQICELPAIYSMNQLEIISTLRLIFTL
jgi:glutamine cyclotransferase